MDELSLPQDSPGDEASQLSSSCAVRADPEPLFNDVEQAVEEASDVVCTAGLPDTVITEDTNRLQLQVKGWVSVLHALLCCSAEGVAGRVHGVDERGGGHDGDGPAARTVSE